jgi:hypothetical protein
MEARTAKIVLSPWRHAADRDRFRAHRRRRFHRGRVTAPQVVLPAGRLRAFATPESRSGPR